MVELSLGTIQNSVFETVSASGWLRFCIQIWMRFCGEKTMADKENYRVAIDILCCHLGMSFDEACAELGLADDENHKLQQVSENASSLSMGLLEDSK
ncbi:hypothetical protein P4S70_22100 [Enterovibrio sp. Hal110]